MWLKKHKENIVLRQSSYFLGDAWLDRMSTVVYANFINLTHWSNQPLLLDTATCMHMYTSRIWPLQLLCTYFLWIRISNHSYTHTHTQTHTHTHTHTGTMMKPYIKCMPLHISHIDYIPWVPTVYTYIRLYLFICHWEIALSLSRWRELLWEQPSNSVGDRH